MIRRLRRHDSSARQEARQAARETEQSLVSALQDSDTPSELLHDELEDAEPDSPIPGAGHRRRNGLLGALVLAALGLLVARRRR